METRDVHLALDLKVSKSPWKPTTECLTEWSAFSGQNLSLNAADGTVTVQLAGGETGDARDGWVLARSGDGSLRLLSKSVASNLQDVPAA